MGRSVFLTAMTVIMMACVLLCRAGWEDMLGGATSDDDDSDDNGSSTEDDAASDGTVNVLLSGAAPANGDLCVAYAYEPGVTTLGDPSSVLAIGSGEISNGAVSLTLKETDASGMPTQTDWSATGGNS
ncbi:MAG: hypothetical protein V5A74_08285 [Desulfohalobiaceae bacterium]